MSDHDFGDDRDPLLVRPFVLSETASPTADPSTQTWPSATTREARFEQPAAGAEPTQVIDRPAPPRRRFRRRLLVIIGAGAVVVLAAAAAGFAALRPGMSASVSAGPAGSPLPAVTGPASAGIVSAGTVSAGTVSAGTVSAGTGPKSAPGATNRAHRAGSASAKASATTSPAPAHSAAAGFGGSAAAGAAARAPETTAPQNFAPATARTGTIRGQNGLCLDLNGGVAVDDNHVQVFTCNGTPAQTWTLATDGTLRVAGMCARIVADDSVHIVTCDGRTTTQWRISDSTLINAADSQCLTDPSGGSHSGAGVVVSTCGGSASQRWSLP